MCWKGGAWECTGWENSPILANSGCLSEGGCRIEIRSPLVWGCNDGECVKIGEFLMGIKGIERVKGWRYHAFAASKYRALGMPCALPRTETSAEDVQGAVRLLKSMDLPAE